ncbi:MAG TPA: hypothetical protein VKD72_07745 [Gemmataceae bacterium]|nr:hypothetical protein [Gemmataceae bacterium]
MRRPLVLAALLTVLSLPRSLRAEGVTLSVRTPMSPPVWALLERELLRANAAACREFYQRYFDERGYLRCVERWGGDDGPDDAIENCTDWPILHALGGPDDVLRLYKQAWEGHLRQYTAAKTKEVPFARDGMYYKEFPVHFDWLHNSEGLTPFNVQGLSDPYDRLFQQRVRRFAGFYLNEDAGASNYDARHKIIRSLFNGSRGPLLRKATALDWAGDPIEVENRFRLGHAERSYKEMLEHFKEYNDILGDHPLNLLSTSLAVNAYMLRHEDKYRRWLLEYVEAWRQRMADNGNIIPTNVGLDGKIGSACGGKWYGGVYGWGFSVRVPQTGATAHRNLHHKGFIGFMNAYLLTGDDRYLDPWRKQIDAVNAQKKMIDGRLLYPTMYGDKGWYAWEPKPYAKNTRELYYLSMKPADRARMGPDRWVDYLEGKDDRYPEDALRTELDRVRRRVQGMRADTTTPDTRLADDPLRFGKANVVSLIELTLGGIHLDRNGAVLHCRLRYFDPARRRAGLPEDVAARVEKLTSDAAVVTLVNINQLDARTVVVQAGGYGEHEFLTVRAGSGKVAVNGTSFTVRLAPGAGASLTLQMRRYVNQPALPFPWDRGRTVEQDEK